MEAGGEAYYIPIATPSPPDFHTAPELCMSFSSFPFIVVYVHRNHKTYQGRGNGGAMNSSSKLVPTPTLSLPPSAMTVPMARTAGQHQLTSLLKGLETERGQYSLSLACSISIPTSSST